MKTKWIDVDKLKKWKACDRGIEAFIKYYGEDMQIYLAKVVTDIYKNGKCALYQTSDDVDWLLDCVLTEKTYGLFCDECERMYERQWQKVRPSGTLFSWKEHDIKWKAIAYKYVKVYLGIKRMDEVR